MRTDARDFGLAFVVLVLWVSLFLGACAPVEAPTGQPGTAATPGPSTQVSGYPGPGATLPPVPINPAIVTPLPGETVQTGPMTLAANPQDSLPFKWREEQVVLAAGTTSRLFLVYQGQDVQLGNDSGGAQFWSASPQYLAWSFGTVGSPLSFKPGLYVHVVATGKDILIDDREHVGVAKLAGDWVAYADWNAPTVAPGATRYDAPQATHRLIGYNLVTGQSVTVTTGLPGIMRGIPGSGDGSYFGLGGNHVGWIEYDLQKQIYTMKLEDLGSGAVQTLNVPLQKPTFFSLSSNLAVWRDTYWHGYSLDRNAAFTIPYAPKEWETKSGIIATARDSAVEWDIPVSNTAHQYYTAPVINK